MFLKDHAHGVAVVASIEQKMEYLMSPCVERGSVLLHRRNAA